MLSDDSTLRYGRRVTWPHATKSKYYLLRFAFSQQILMHHCYGDLYELDNWKSNNSYTYELFDLFLIPCIDKTRIHLYES